MNSDFRIAVDFADSPKLEKLVRRRGEEAVRKVLRLFGWTARNRPDGILRNLDAEDIAIASGWSGDADQWISDLSELRIIDLRSDDQWYQIHNWTEHNPWAAGSDGRSKWADELNHRRWHVDRAIIEPACKFCVPSNITSDDQSQIRTDIRTESDAESPSLLPSSLPSMGTPPINPPQGGDAHRWRGRRRGRRGRAPVSYAAPDAGKRYRPDHKRLMLDGTIVDSAGNIVGRIPDPDEEAHAAIRAKQDEQAAEAQHRGGAV